MDVAEILGWSGGGLALLLTFLQIAPIKVSPWSWLGKQIGRAINGEVLEKMDKLEKKIDEVDKKTDAVSDKCELQNAVQCRVRILRFGDEILHDSIRHSKEHFDQILLDITDYEQYCDVHPSFRNHVAMNTIQMIERTYQEKLENGGFA